MSCVINKNFYLLTIKYFYFRTKISIILFVDNEEEGMIPVHNNDDKMTLLGDDDDDDLLVVDTSFGNHSGEFGCE